MQELCLLENSNEWYNTNNYKINGVIDLFSYDDPGFLDIFINVLKIKRQEHLAYITEIDNKIIVLIKIFDVFAASVVISQHPDFYKIPENNLIIIDSVLRKFKKSSFNKKLL